MTCSMPCCTRSGKPAGESRAGQIGQEVYRRRPAEARGSQQRGGHHRGGGRALPRNEDGQDRDAAGHADGRHRRMPNDVSGVDEPEGQQQQAGGTQRDPQDVEGAGFRLPGLRDRGQADDHGRDTDRDIDPEDR